MGVLLLHSCAQISAPTGGKPDVLPPTLDSLGTVPLNYSTNFVGDKVVLTFNEYFVLKNPTANVFFSPSVENEPEFIIKGKVLTILLNNTLKENTTYTINFGDAISDYTVGNKIPDFKYVFSTGNFIDSMQTSGKVIDAYSGKPAEDLLVLLYDDFSDSVVSKSKPVYYTKTDKEGNYKITYVKAGTYKLMALKDENRNFLYDLPNEKIGYLDTLLPLTNDSILSASIISVFTPDYEKQRITTKKYEYPGKLTLAFLKSADSIAVLDEQLASVNYVYKELSENRDSLIYWNPNLGNEKSVVTVVMDTTKETVNIYPFKVPKKIMGVKTFKIKKGFDIEIEVDIVSAHRTPEKLFDYGKNAHTKGFSVIIAGAGGAAHLPGMIASLSPLPVIGVPVKSSNSIDGWDSVLSILQMPGGVPVATVALNGAKNAGILAAQIIGTSDKCVLDKVIVYKQGLEQMVHESAKDLK